MATPINWHAYVNTAIVAHAAKKLGAAPGRSWDEAIEIYATLRRTIEADLRKSMPPKAYAIIQSKGVAFLDNNVVQTKRLRITTAYAPQMKWAHRLLHYDAADFTSCDYATKEALLYAVYEAHRQSRETGALLEKMFDNARESGAFQRHVI